MKLFTIQERNVIALLSFLLIAGLVVAELKKRNYTGSDSTITYFYANLNEEDIKFAGLVNINSAGIEELSTLPGVGKRQQKNL